jgi:hypothetical protein
MNILCLGCSWTEGVPAARDNWVSALAEQTPDNTYYNLAQGGSSLLHSIWVMEQFLAQSSVKIDKIIFQLTTDGRVTYYKDLDNFKIDDWLINITPNLYRLKIQWDKLRTITYSTASMHPTTPKEVELFKFANMYYSNLTTEHHFQLEHKILIEYIKSRVDFLFFHRRDTTGISGITSIQDELGDELFSKFSIDNGSHFGKEGVQWQAQWIRDRLIL